MSLKGDSTLSSTQPYLLRYRILSQVKLPRQVGYILPGLSQVILSPIPTALPTSTIRHRLIIVQRSIAGELAVSLQVVALLTSDLHLLTNTHRTIRTGFSIDDSSNSRTLQHWVTYSLLGNILDMDLHGHHWEPSAAGKCTNENCWHGQLCFQKIVGECQLFAQKRAFTVKKQPIGRELQVHH